MFLDIVGLFSRESGSAEFVCVLNKIVILPSLLCRSRIYALTLHFHLIKEALVCYVYVALGALLIIVLAIDPRFAGSYPAEDNEFLRVIKIRSTTSFGEEVKPSAPCRNILRHVKEHCRYEKIYFVGNIHCHFFAKLPLLHCRCLLITARELWWINQE
jgi:hypothetical protein